MSETITNFKSNNYGVKSVQYVVNKAFTMLLYH